MSLKYRELKITPTLIPAELGIISANLDDLEKVRIASENRYRILTTNEADKDGEVRGFGLDPNNKSVKRIRDVADKIAEAEKDAIKALELTMKGSALLPWIEEQKGAGLKTMGRFLSCIGDPFYHYQRGTARVLPELWAYCGLHTVMPEGESDNNKREAARRRKGQKANWDMEARKRLYVITESLVKQGVRKAAMVDDEGNTILDENGEPKMCRYGITKWGDIYVARRERNSELHGPDSEVPWTDAHSDMDAKRILGREFLRDLWKESRDIHLRELGEKKENFDPEVWND